MSKKSQDIKPDVSQVAAEPGAFAPPVERLSDQDKLALDLLKSKQETAREKARAAMLGVELADQQCQNFVMTLATRYGLVDGDVIEENGVVTRKGRK